MAIANNGGTPVQMQPSHARSADTDRDPLAPIFALGNRAAKTGAVIGLLIALLTHGYA